MILDYENLTTYISSVNKLKTKKPKLNEPNTKLKAIQPLFELLGWNFASDEVEAEYPIQVGSTIAHVDYALKLDNHPIILIEAKGFDSELDEKFIKQAYSYSRISKVKWYVLTNGKELHLYNSDWGDDFDKSLVFKGKVKNYAKLINELSLLSPDSLKQKIIETEANKLWYKRNVKNFIKEKPDKVAKKIAGWIQGEIGGWNRKDVEIAISELIKEKMKKKKPEHIQVNKENNNDKIKEMDKDKSTEGKYTIDYYFKNKEKTRELFNKLQIKISELGNDVKFYCTAKDYLSLRVLGKYKKPPAIIEFYPKTPFLKMNIKLNYEDVSEKKDIIRDYSEISFWSRGAIQVKYSNQEDIDYVFSLIKKAYEREKDGT